MQHVLLHEKISDLRLLFIVGTPRCGVQSAAQRLRPVGRRKPGHAARTAQRAALPRYPRCMINSRLPA